MAKSKEILEPVDGIRVPITSDYIRKCRQKHVDVLVNKIKDDHAPPSDGEIFLICQAIHQLDLLIPVDDKAGRGAVPGEDLSQ